MMQPDLPKYNDSDWADLPVKYLILSCKEYIVFIDNENDIDWQTSDSFDAIELTPEALINENQIKNEVASLESIPCNELEEKVILNFKRQVGESLVRAFDGDYENAKHMLTLAKEYITNRNVEQSRYMYLLASGISTLVIITISIFFWLFKTSITMYVGTTVFYLIASSLVGSVGAFLSIILRIGKTDMDYNARRKLHYLEAASKIFAGMISGFLIALCVLAGIIVPLFSKIESTHLAMILGGFIAGSSERLAPSIITKLGGKK